MPFDQSTTTKQVKFTYSPLGKAFEKQIKTLEGPGREKVEALEALKPEENQQDQKSIERIFPKEIRTNGIKTWGKN